MKTDTSDTSGVRGTSDINGTGGLSQAKSVILRRGAPTGARRTMGPISGVHEAAQLWELDFEEN